jgi:hypothetical protein
VAKLEKPSRELARTVFVPVLVEEVEGLVRWAKAQMVSQIAD